MPNVIRTSCVLSVLAASAITIVPTARGDIVGLNSLTGWSYNTGDTGSPPVIVTSDEIQFTTGPNNRRSVWFNTPQNIGAFTATFTYRASSISASAVRQGLTFAVHNDPASLAALGSGGSGFGYAGIGQSAAVTIETDTSPARTYNGLYTGGVLGGGSAQTTPVNAFSFQPIDVTITYSGSVLSVSIVQGANTFGPQNYVVGSLPAIVGGSTAYVGFTAATFNTLGSGGGANQFISNVRFTSVPTPAGLPLLLVGSAAAGWRRRFQ